MTLSFFLIAASQAAGVDVGGFSPHPRFGLPWTRRVRGHGTALRSFLPMNASAPLSAEPPERDQRNRSSDRDPRYTMQVARTALDRIAALNLPADPHSF